MVHFLFFPNTALLGASGIVFMMIAMSSLAGMKDGSIPITLILVLTLYIGGEIVNGFVLQDNVSQITHIIGGICGALLGLSMRK
ncbi:MAG: rhomboid family intramembrane serine protease [Oscillospiraceae bacterium]